MKKIEKEINRLLELAATNQLPGYPAPASEGSFFSQSPAVGDLTEYNSGEMDALARQLEEIWAHAPQMKPCIPLILAAIEKSKEQETHALIQTELYNYTM